MIPWELAVKNSKKNPKSRLEIISGDDHNEFTHSQPIIADFLKEVSLKN